LTFFRRKYWSIRSSTSSSGRGAGSFSHCCCWWWWWWWWASSPFASSPAPPSGTSFRRRGSGGRRAASPCRTSTPLRGGAPLATHPKIILICLFAAGKGRRALPSTWTHAHTRLMAGAAPHYLSDFLTGP
jgi:hypothetical protein